MSLYNAEQLTKAVLESLGILVGGGGEKKSD